MKYGIHSLVFKQCAIILLGFTLVFVALFGVLKYQVGNRVSDLLMERGSEISEKNVNLINRIFSEAELVGQNVYEQLGKERPDAEAFPRTLKVFLEAARERIPEVVSIVFATEPSEFGEYMRLARVEGDSVVVIKGSNYTDKEWFQSVKKSGKPMWQEPFVGDFIKEPIAVYTIPVMAPADNGTQKFLGVICVDISVGFLQSSISSIQVDSKGYAFVLSSKNTIVAHPNNELVYKASLSSLKGDNPSLAELENDIRQKSSGVVLGARMNGEAACIYYTSMMMKGWTFGIVWPSDKFFERQRDIARYFMISLACGYVFLFLLVLLVSFRVARPLNRMSRVAHALGKGNFDVKIPSIRGKDEVAQFAQAFNKMRESLIEYIENLKNVTDQKQRMEGELKVARDIQLGVLPRDEDEECMRDNRHELSAFLEPARGVGGDFYDFYPLDKDRIVVLIADVSGKGIPAALFMMSVRTQLKSLALAGHGVDELFAKANDRLCHKNDSNMFVTVWMGVIDLRNGHVDFCCAGHNPPVVCHADGTVDFIKSKAGLVLAGMPGMKYKLQSFDMVPGDTLFLYTDGVTEASNEWDKFFGDARLLSSLKTANGIPTEKICGFVKSQIDEFVGSAPQFDDITMLALKFKGDEGKV